MSLAWLNTILILVCKKQKNFVNRLIMNQIDGKLVEVEASAAEKELSLSQSNV